MYGYGSLKQRILCLFNWFRSYSKIASKGGVGGLKSQSTIVVIYVPLQTANCFLVLFPGKWHHHVTSSGNKAIQTWGSGGMQVWNELNWQGTNLRSVGVHRWLITMLYTASPSDPPVQTFSNSGVSMCSMYFSISLLRWQPKVRRPSQPCHTSALMISLC